MKKTSRKARAAWGSLMEVRRGEVYRLRYWASTPQGYVRRCETIHGSRMEAERRRSELMLAHSADAPCPTVAQVWERWALPAYERRVDGGEMAASSVRQMESWYRSSVAPTWADVPCDQIRPLAVQQWLDGLTHSKAGGAMKVMRPLMDYPVRYGLIDSNPMRERYLMPSKATVECRDDGVWTLAQLGELWRIAHGSWIEAAFLLAAFGGMRVGESLGVRSVDVSVTEVCGQQVTMVTVRRQVTNLGAVSERLKTAQSARTVPIVGRAGARVAEIAAESDWLTGDGIGSHSTQKALNAGWREVMAEVDAPMRHPLRNLRNSWQTNMRWTLRVPPWAIEPVMGHSVAGVTGQYYDRPAAEMYAEVFAQAYDAVPFDAGWNWLDGKS